MSRVGDCRVLARGLGRPMAGLALWVALAASGARLVDIGHNDRGTGAGVRGLEAWEIETALTPSVVAMAFSVNATSIVDLPTAIAVCRANGIPLIVDNTTATPFLCRPIELGATLVVHSATKYLTGNGTVTGGVVVDSGKFDWSKSGKFPSLSEPEPAYHGLAFHPALGAMAFTFHSIAIGLRDLGMTMNPQGAHYTLMGIETLSLRMEKHLANAKAVSEWLEADPRVEFVTYAGLKTSPWNDRVAKVCPKGAGALFTVGVKGGYDSCVKLVNMAN